MVTFMCLGMAAGVPYKIQRGHKLCCCRTCCDPGPPVFFFLPSSTNKTTLAALGLDTFHIPPSARQHVQRKRA